MNYYQHIEKAIVFIEENLSSKMCSMILLTLPVYRSFIFTGSFNEKSEIDIYIAIA